MSWLLGIHAVRNLVFLLICFKSFLCAYPRMNKTMSINSKTPKDRVEIDIILPSLIVRVL